jgi:hypothetical protein
MGVAVETGVEAVEEGDGTESRAGHAAVVTAEALIAVEALKTEQRLDLNAAHEPVISLKLVEEVPLTGLSF